MRRAVTTTFIAGWFGFLTVSSLIAIAAILLVARLPTPPFGFLSGQIETIANDMLRGGNLAVLATTLEAVASMTIAAVLALSCWLVQSPSRADRNDGERLALLAMIATGLVYAAGYAFDVPIYAKVATPFGMAVTLALSAFAILVDRMTEIEEPADDERDFRAALTMIGQQMARNPADAVRPPNAKGR